MKAGRLDRRITIQQNTPSTNSFGEQDESWADLDTVWAEVRTQSGREIFAAGTQAEIDIAFRIRHRTDLTRAMRIVYDGDNYDILAINEIGRREGLEIVGKAQVA